VRWLLVLLIAAYSVTDVFGLGMSLMTGLSVKNLLLYLVVSGLMFRMALTGGERMHYTSLHIAFAVLIGYAGVSWILAAVVIKYPGYHLFEHLVTLKTWLIDPALLMFAAFYGLRDLEDTRYVLKALLLAIGAANFLTNLDTAHIIHLGMKIGERGAEAGRVFGAFGHANETGSMLVCFLAPMIAMLYTTRAFERFVWLGATLSTAVVLLMTVSRGAFVGLFVGGVWAMWICRRYIPIQRFVVGAFAGLFFAVLTLVVASLVDPNIGGTILDRLTGQSSSIDAGEMSSGRVDIWAGALKRMLETPGTFVWGFGWDVYSTMPFRYAAHNTYLLLWFELGLTGVMTFLFILGRTTLASFYAIQYAKDPQLHAQFVAFVFGFLMLAVAMTFADLITPWPYIWLYVGLMLKLCTYVQEEAQQSFKPLRVAQVPTRQPATSMHGALPRGVR
jgi:hypothetical protein